MPTVVDKKIVGYTVKTADPQTVAPQEEVRE